MEENHSRTFFSDKFQDCTIKMVMPEAINMIVGFLHFVKFTLLFPTVRVFFFLSSTSNKALISGLFLDKN